MGFALINRSTVFPLDTVVRSWFLIASREIKIHLLALHEFTIANLCRE